MCKNVNDVNKFLDFLPDLENIVKQLQTIYENKIESFKKKYRGILSVDNNA